jgi:hypothetical protein
MVTKYEAANSANWEAVWSEDFTAPAPPGGVSALERYYPIEEITIPQQLETSLIAFYASSSTAEAGWRYAASVRQKFITPLLGGGTPNAIGSNKRIWLNQWTLLHYSVSFGTTYSLIVKVPFWMRQISLQLYAYTGPVNHMVQPTLNQILQELQNP